MVATRSRDYDLNPVLNSSHTIRRGGNNNNNLFMNHDDDTHAVVAATLLTISASISVGVFITTFMV
jgi:nitric oxide reductase activation protein